MPLRSILRSFAHRNFRLFFTGQGLSLIGTQVQIVALPWFVYRLTGSAGWLGWMTFAGQFPAVLCTPFAGVLADRVSKRRLLLVTQTLSLVQASLLAALTLLDLVELWQLLALNVGLSLVNAFDLTARQSLLVEMIDDPADLGNAIALNSSMFNATRLIGPSIAGLLIGWIGEGGCFLVNAVSFLAVLLALLAMRLPPKPANLVHHSALTGLLEGVRFAAGSMPVRALLLLVMLISFLAVPYNVLMPVVVRQVFHGTERLNGAMFSASGLGALSGAMFLASRHSILGFLRRIWLLPVIAGVTLLVLSLVGFVPAAMATVFFTGMSVVMLLTACNTILQTIVEDRLRGRLVSIYAMTFTSMAPLGGLLAGWLTDQIGVRATLRINGVVLTAAAALFALTLAGPLHRRVAEILARHVREAPPDSEVDV